MIGQKALALTTSILAALILLLSASPAEAACNPLSGCSCTATATGISFGSYNPVSSSDNDATGTISVHCDLVAALAGSYTIDISPGSSGTYNPRKLNKGGSILNYNVYIDAARNQIWGDGSGGSTNVSRSIVALLSFNDSVTVYGRIPSGQNVASGAGYMDTLTITITY